MGAQIMKPKPAVIRGTAENNGEFKGVEGLGWLYVGRATPASTPDKLENYLKELFPGEHFVVQELQKHESNTNTNISYREIVIDQKEKKTSKWNTKELKDMKNKLEALQVVKTVRRDAESKKAYDIFKKIYNLKINEKIKENNENQIRKASNKSRAMWKIIKPAKGKSEEEKSNLTAGEMN
ncbi:hypothetical protein HHI36_002925 [Cryptolaemus montrouzieri]|uniref:Uncharacterized protein n=1 Tax=Cryptolaemus montrouzieri TaxID=559131 RepID=A0ABD2PCG1_9CUCU